MAFDGDGDRALFVDHAGRDRRRRRHAADGGDLAEATKAGLPGDAVVATVMSNIGLEIALRERGIELVRTAVGDKYVMEEMVKRGLALGGEQSGHVIFSDHLFTGDGIGHGAERAAHHGRHRQGAVELAGALVTYPQVLVNVRVRERDRST